MSKPFNLLEGNPIKLFSRYLLPSVSATFVTSIYIIVDTVMIGRGVGADALVALNLILPVFSLLFAIGMLFGVGGGVLMSIAHGAGNTRDARAAFSTALVAAVGCATVVLLLSSLFLRPLCFLLGANENNVTLVMEYGAYIAHFAPVFLFSTFLQAFVRNDRDPTRAMVAVLSGALANIGLDYLFIFPLQMGMAGGAIATVIGNVLTVLILLTHFLSPANTMRWDRTTVSCKTLCRILTSGAPSCLVEAAAGIVTFSFNRQIIKYLGNASIVLYGIVANCAIVCMSVFNGIAQAAQPIFAANYGAKQYDRVGIVRHCGLVVAAVLGILLASTSWWMPDLLISLFVEPSPALLVQGPPILRLYFTAFLAMGINLFCATYFQSVIRPIQALCITLLRGVALPLLLVLGLPFLFGGQSIWCVMPVNEFLTLLTCVLLLLHTPLEKVRA